MANEFLLHFSNMVFTHIFPLSLRGDVSVGNQEGNNQFKRGKTIELFEFADKSVLSKASLPGPSPQTSLVIFVVLQGLVCFRVNKIQDFFSLSVILLAGFAQHSEAVLTFHEDTQSVWNAGIPECGTEVISV